MAPLLEGIRVIDLTSVLSGPYACYQLALMGAEVIKVEIPRVGDQARGLRDDGPLDRAGMAPSFVAQNAGKRSITINLKSAAGSEVFGRLVARSDVLMENMRPGVLERLGFSWPRLHEINQGLVYCALTGFGQTGPLSARPAYDQIIQGLAGMADVTGEPSGSPLRVGFPVCDTFGGLTAAMAVCAALARRNQDGQGAFLDVSMLEASLTSLGWVASDQLVGGRKALRHGNDNPISSPSGTFRTQDGLLNIATNTNEQFERLCKALGVAELAHNPLFASRDLRRQHREQLRDELEAVLSEKPAADWEIVLEAARVPAGRVLTVGEALEQDQVRDRGLMHRVELPVSSPSSVQIFGSGVHVDGQALAPQSPPPKLGEHTTQILAWLGYGTDEVDTLVNQGAV